MYYSDYNRPPEDRDSVIETNQFHVYDAEPPKKKKKGGFGKFIAVGLCCAIIGGAVGGGGVWAVNRFGGNSTTIYEGTRPTAVSLANVDGKTVLSAEEVYASNLESVVGVNGNVTTNVWGQTVKNAVSGSGFVISSNDTASYILTNYHVINGVSDITVFFSDGKSYDATLVGGEEENDIAVLKIDQGNLRPVVLGDSDAINVGEDVYAIGNPLGELTFTFTGGYVSAKDRSVTMSDGTVMNMIQTDTAINSGNSGGPLFNEYGQVIGIVSAKLSSSSSSEASVEGLGFAIPINDVSSMIQDIMTNGYVSNRAYLGATIGTLNASMAQQYRYDITEGAFVYSVEDGGPADQAGLQLGDVITAIDDTEITSLDDLTAARKSYTAGDTCTLTVYRQGETITLQLTWGAAPAEQQAESQSQTQQDNSQSGGYIDPNDLFNYFFG